MGEEKWKVYWIQITKGEDRNKSLGNYFSKWKSYSSNIWRKS